MHQTQIIDFPRSDDMSPSSAGSNFKFPSERTISRNPSLSTISTSNSESSNVGRRKLSLKSFSSRSATSVKLPSFRKKGGDKAVVSSQSLVVTITFVKVYLPLPGNPKFIIEIDQMGGPFILQSGIFFKEALKLSTRDNIAACESISGENKTILIEHIDRGFIYFTFYIGDKKYCLNDKNALEYLRSCSKTKSDPRFKLVSLSD